MIRALGRVLHADARELALEVPGWPGQRPGQFAMLQLEPQPEGQPQPQPEGAGRGFDPLLPRPMAVFRAHGERVEFRHKVVGRGTRRLSELSAGALLGVLGPLGNGFPELAGPAILVGGGTGIASLYEQAARTPGARVLLGGRAADDILGLRDFEKLDCALALATEDGSLGRRGLVTELLAPEAGDTVLACGPTAMMDACRAAAERAGARCYVSLESQMACGFGVCLGCAVRTQAGFRYVCSDGPVFDARELDWDELA